jgi:hypothetical protein
MPVCCDGEDLGQNQGSTQRCESPLTEEMARTNVALAITKLGDMAVLLLSPLLSQAHTRVQPAIRSASQQYLQKRRSIKYQAEQRDDLLSCETSAHCWSPIIRHCRLCNRWTEWKLHFGSFSCRVEFPQGDHLRRSCDVLRSSGLSVYHWAENDAHTVG